MDVDDDDELANHFHKILVQAVYTDAGFNFHGTTRAINQPWAVILVQFQGEVEFTRQRLNNQRGDLVVSGLLRGERYSD